MTYERYTILLGRMFPVLHEMAEGRVIMMVENLMAKNREYHPQGNLNPRYALINHIRISTLEFARYNKELIEFHLL